MAEQLQIVAWGQSGGGSGFIGDYAKTHNRGAWPTYYTVALTPHAPAQAALDELRREVEALRADAERYRTLRNSLSHEAGCSHMAMPRITDPRNSMLTYTPGGLDCALDMIRAERDTARAQSSSNSDEGK
jgi:hypothetical protein